MGRGKYPRDIVGKRKRKVRIRDQGGTQARSYCFFFWERGGVGGQAKADEEGKSINGTGTPESLLHELNWLIGRRGSMVGN